MLVSEAITAGYREADIITIGTEPTDDEYEEALGRLNDFRLKLFGSEFGENLEDWTVASTVQGLPDNLVSPNMGETFYLCPRVNSRILVTVNADTTIKFPENPTDGSRIMFRDVNSTSVEVTLDGNGRLIDGQSTQVDTPQAFNARQWFYRADLASWQVVSTLGLNDTLPLPEEYNDLFICYIAIRMSPRSAQTASDATKQLFGALLKQAKARYRQTQAIAVADPRISTSLDSFGNGQGWFL